MSLLSYLLGAGEASGARKRPPPAQTKVLINGRSALVIARNSTSLHEERGWHKSGNTLHGFYRTPFGSSEGRIEHAWSKAEYYIMDPPRALLDGPHGACFRQRDGRTFYIHWNTRPKDIDSGILHIERCLMEALS